MYKETKLEYHRNLTIDTIKGLLILLVVFGHLMSGGYLTSFIKEYIYIFHMALFFGISGFLIKKEFFLNFSVLEIVKKYFFRLIVPFMFAYIVYCFLNQEVISLLYPWYHLWFIPAFILMIFYILILEKFKINRFVILFLLSIFTFSWLFFYEPGSGEKHFYYLGDKRYYYFFLFMYLGYFLRNYSILNKRSLYIMLLSFTVSNFIIFFTSYRDEFKVVKSFIFISFNISLIYISIYFFKKFQNINIPIINTLGILTLPIYLWHIVPLVIIEKYFYLIGWSRLCFYLILFAGLIVLINKIQMTKLGRIFITGQY